MPTLSDKAIAGAVMAAGFPRTSWQTAVAVALAESGGNPEAFNGSNSDGSADYGLFQINSVHAELLNSHRWRDPVDNARMAYEISSHGSNWHPWVAYTTGRHVPYLGRARRAVSGPVAVPGNTSGTAPGGSVQQTSSIPVPGIPGGDFLSFLSDSRTWIRGSMVLLGGVLILLALSKYTTADNKLFSLAKVATTRGVVK